LSRLSLCCPDGVIYQMVEARRTTPDGARVSAADGSHWEAAPSEFAQQARSNLTARAHASHHSPAIVLWCNGLLREGSWWVLWWGSLDGMQEVRQSALLAGTRYAGVVTRSASVADEVPVDRGAADAEGRGDRRHRVLPTGMHLSSHLKLVDGLD
jgi:hypothetical protein